MKFFFQDISSPEIPVLKFNEVGIFVLFFFNAARTIEVQVSNAGAHVYIFALFIGKENDVFEIKTIQHHTAPNTESYLFLKAVLDGNSRLHHEGLVKIEKGAHGASAHQKSAVLKLSSDSFIDSRPFLEIFANDVSCTHGSSIGGFNESLLLYLMSRGLSREGAERVYVEGFIEEVFERIEELGCGEEMEEYREKIAALLSFRT